MESVLVVDDEAGLRNMMARWVEAMGYSAKVAESADDALEQVSEEPAAVALCDIRMPGHDGFWLAQQLRARHPETALIMATGFDGPDASISSLHVGAIDYLRKPFAATDLRQALQRAVEWHRSMAEKERWRRKLEGELHRRQAEAADAIVRAEITSAATLDARLAILFVRDPDAQDHARRVAQLSVKIALLMGVCEPDVCEVNGVRCCTTLARSRCLRRFCKSLQSSLAKSVTSFSSIHRLDFIASIRSWAFPGASFRAASGMALRIRSVSCRPFSMRRARSTSCSRVTKGRREISLRYRRIGSTVAMGTRISFANGSSWSAGQSCTRLSSFSRSSQNSVRSDEAKAAIVMAKPGNASHVPAVHHDGLCTIIRIDCDGDRGPTTLLGRSPRRYAKNFLRTHR